jgi:hypothetical protein
MRYKQFAAPWILDIELRGDGIWPWGERFAVSRISSRLPVKQEPKRGGDCKRQQ